MILIKLFLGILIVTTYAFAFYVLYKMIKSTFEDDMANGKQLSQEGAEEILDIIDDYISLKEACTKEEMGYTKEEVEALGASVTQRPLGAIVIKGLSKSLDGEWLPLDGRKISKTKYKGFYEMFGARALCLPDLNAGVDPDDEMNTWVVRVK